MCTEECEIVPKRPGCESHTLLPYGLLQAAAADKATPGPAASRASETFRMQVESANTLHLEGRTGRATLILTCCWHKENPSCFSILAFLSRSHGARRGKARPRHADRHTELYMRDCARIRARHYEKWKHYQSTSDWRAQVLQNLTVPGAHLRSL